MNVFCGIFFVIIKRKWLRVNTVNSMLFGAKKTIGCRGTHADVLFYLSLEKANQNRYGGI